ncbi:metal ABC transporter permease [Pigmentiphaga litoralis]|uniref:Zinc/manganese transport system permease protein n=1 Tax=Pigmentiphaga litoralis TaxID=516702 RepID=A0A7Y9LKP3_9BURK|nr:metal ABC transporter permease [Pigmentiphaga litoralis]NYE23242.1 zinc/manganese transport system permease protein [Pigmentiphaga litoralis]NYE83144.1 zinc/manganese transport system permease protein [Pigmentiphaga litoralis]
MTAAELLWQPFSEFAFMRHALAACLALAIGCAPVGVFLVLRRMSLVGDALSHAILPGAALGFILFGLSLTAMSLGGLVVGLAVMIGAGAVTRAGALREDASFAAFYLISLSLGVLLVSKWGSNLDLMHILFGSVLAVDDGALLFLAGVTSLTLLMLALFYRMWVVDSFDPDYLRSLGKSGAVGHGVFLGLVVLNLVAGFQALGTLMAVGLMMLPAVSARLWARSLPGQIGAAMAIAAVSAYVGLLVSYHGNLPSGPAIVLTAGSVYLLSLLASMFTRKTYVQEMDGVGRRNDAAGDGIGK